MGANLSEANLSKADLSKAHLFGADLSGADLQGARLFEVDFFGANLDGTNFEDSTDKSWEQEWDEKEAMRRSRAGGGAGGGPDEPFEPSSEYEPTELVEDISHTDEVFFTAIHPKEGKVETWYTLLIYAHLKSAVEDVRQDAQRFKDQIQASREFTSSTSTPIVRGTEITIVPTCDELEFNPDHTTIKWLEDYHRADFRFRANKALSNDAARGNIDIYVGPIPIGTLKFAMLFNEFR